MPNKYPEKKGWKVPKQKYKISNWHDYNEFLKQRGNIEIWLSEDVIAAWYEAERVYDGTGAPKKFSDSAIMTCHEIRLVFKLPLRQCQGFIDSLFLSRDIALSCPDYTCLSKRLAQLNLSVPRYKKANKMNEDIVAIAIDSTGLKRFGRDEWHQEKHNVAAKRCWRKLHIAVDNQHIIHASVLTDRLTSDDQMIDELADQIDVDVDHITADGAYDKTPVYNDLSTHFPSAEIIIPPDSDAVYNTKNHAQRNRNLQEIKTFGRMAWQKVKGYGKRNYSELSIQRYKKIIGRQLHAREFSRQKNEAMLGCGILNKMTGLGMPKSYRCA